MPRHKTQQNRLRQDTALVRLPAKPSEQRAALSSLAVLSQ